MARNDYKNARALYAAATAVVLLLPVHVDAEGPGDPRLGLTYAVANCAECHEVNGVRDRPQILARQVSQASPVHRD